MSAERKPQAQHRARVRASLSPIARLKRRFYLELAGLSTTLRRNDSAFKHYHSALRVSPEDPLVLASMGFALAKQDRKREAIACFDRAIATNPHGAEWHFDRAFLLQELNHHDEAIPGFERAIALNPNHDRAYYGLGLSLIHLRRLDEAVPPLERNTKLQPMSPYGWYQLGRTQFNRGKVDKAQAIIDHLSHFEPKVAGQLARETGLRAPAT
ncbi:MAG: tetratricopeptide repeat protein [Betaproteobacteria bacterium]